MLRDVLTRLPGVDTWPCDEINYIWRHGNVRHNGDEFPPDLARPEVIAYIRRRFDQIARRYRAHTVVEKTCANSLRVGFVDRVVPEAKYVVICRNGLDVVDSAARRWKAPLDIPYLARKARYVPLSDMPYYATQYALNRVHKLVSSDRQLAVWGPLPEEAKAWSEQYDLLQMCALQWQHCVLRANEDLALIDASRVHRVRYEEFVANPGTAMKAIVDFLALDADDRTIADITGPVSSSSVGLGRTRLGERQTARLRELIGSTLQDLGYSD